MSAVEKCPRCGATAPVVKYGHCGGCGWSRRLASSGDYIDRLKVAHARAVEEFPKLAAPDGTVAVRIEDLGKVLERIGKVLERIGVN